MLNAGTLGSYGKGLEKLLAHAGIEHLAGNPQQGNQAQPQVFKADVSLLLKGDELLQEEVFGPTTIVIEVEDRAQLAAAGKAEQRQPGGRKAADQVLLTAKHLFDAHVRRHALWPYPAICFLVPMIDSAFLIVEGDAYEPRTFD